MKLTRSRGFSRRKEAYGYVANKIKVTDSLCSKELRQIKSKTKRKKHENETSEIQPSDGGS